MNRERSNRRRRRGGTIGNCVWIFWSFYFGRPRNRLWSNTLFGFIWNRQHCKQMKMNKRRLHLSDETDIIVNKKKRRKKLRPSFCTARTLKSRYSSQWNLSSQRERSEKIRGKNGRKRRINDSNNFVCHSYYLSPFAIHCDAYPRPSPHRSPLLQLRHQVKPRNEIMKL